jgi:hypothetical protein
LVVAAALVALVVAAALVSGVALVIAVTLVARAALIAVGAVLGLAGLITCSRGGPSPSRREHDLSRVGPGRTDNDHARQDRYGDQCQDDPADRWAAEQPWFLHDVTDTHSRRVRRELSGWPVSVAPTLSR